MHLPVAIYGSRLQARNPVLLLVVRVPRVPGAGEHRRLTLSAHSGCHDSGWGFFGAVLVSATRISSGRSVRAGLIEVDVFRHLVGGGEPAFKV